MRTSTEIIQTEKFLRGELSAEEEVVFEAKLLLDADLRKNTFFHKMVHRLLTLYHRKKLRAEVEAVHKRLFLDPARVRFRESILTLFNH